MSFLYSILLKLLYPTSLCLLLLAAAVIFRKHKVACRVCFSVAVAVLLVCGNGWLVDALTKHLEWQYLPPNPVPQADCILILSGGTVSRIPPRPTIEITEAGNRVLYGAYLYRQGKAPRVICTGGLADAATGHRAYADDMADLLEMVGVPQDAIIKETKARDTHEHARNVYPMLQERGIKRVLLVTSAMHMPRSLSTFHRLCTGIEVIPAPTDFRVTERIPAPWYHRIGGAIPTPRHLLDFSEVMHEYTGMAYYRLRGWM
jgi:uncharacterized SAM-binding protein YcdF (DUF218 family)